MTAIASIPTVVVAFLLVGGLGLVVLGCLLSVIAQRARRALLIRHWVRDELSRGWGQLLERELRAYAAHQQDTGNGTARGAHP
ncbi:MAG: hypothetical protein ACRDK2_14270 [Solirubrobacteraceae bacterium]